MNELEFYKAYITFCESGGHSYSLGKIEYYWEKYKKTPERFSYLINTKEK